MFFRSLLTVTGALEGATGLALLAAPSRVAQILLGATIDAHVGLVVARVAGSALLALAIACALTARESGASRAPIGLIAGMLVYNIAVIALLLHARFGWEMSGIATWPAVGLHLVMSAWCARCLTNARATPR